jgi:hypothetical protein
MAGGVWPRAAQEGSVSNFFGEFGTGMFLDVAEELRAPGNEDSLWDSFLAGV